MCPRRWNHLKNIALFIWIFTNQVCIPRGVECNACWPTTGEKGLIRFIDLKIQKWLNSSWRIRSPPPPHILHPLHPQWAICITGKIPTCTILSPSSRPTCVHPAIQACDPLTNDVWVESYLDKLLKIMLVAVFPRWPLLEKHLFLKLMYMNIGENL
jgi:hypothetical protein